MNTVIWVFVWLIFWLGGMGAPVLLFNKRGISYHKNPFLMSLFFIALLVGLFVVYQDYFVTYFNTTNPHLLFILPVLLVVWLLVPRFFNNDYYTQQERLGYQLPKFFEVLFQQVCFLGGLLTFGVSPAIFGLIFFVVHIPAVFVFPKKFAVVPIVGSLVGGVVIAYLQYQGTSGLMLALGLHLFVWIIFSIAFIKGFLGAEPIKR